MTADRFRAYGEDGNVLNEGSVTAGKAKFTAAETVTRVVFYSGPLDEEAVAGCVDVNASGPISAELTEE